MQPVLEVDAGEVVTFETHDCFSGQIQAESDLVTDIDFSKDNPATGPVSVRGADPGDSLIVEILGSGLVPRALPPSSPATASS
jgi:amidase